MTGGLWASAASIDGSSSLLVEVAGLLYAGRLDREVGVMASGRSHKEVGDLVREFAEFADNQFTDLVAVLTALSTKLHEAGTEYVKVDHESQEHLDRILSSGRYVAPEDR